MEGESRGTSQNISGPRSNEVTIRTFRDDDLDALLKLQLAVLNSKRSYEDAEKLWNWKFKTNPFSSIQFPHALVLEHQGRIVGSLEQMAVPIKLGEKSVVASVNCGFAVDEEYRTYGLMLATKFWRNTQIPFLMVTTANEMVCVIHKALGAKELTLVRTRWFRVR